MDIWTNIEKGREKEGIKKENRKILNTTDIQKKEQLIIEYKDKDKQLNGSARRDKRNQLQEKVQ
jgi:hypothetical protein